MFEQWRLFENPLSVMVREGTRMIFMAAIEERFEEWLQTEDGEVIVWCVSH